MANRLQIKRNQYNSNGAPSANSLLTGELAYDGFNQKLYIGRQTDNQGDGSGGLAATDVTVTDLGATIVPIASSTQKGVVKIDTTDFNIANDGGLSLATTATAAQLNILSGATITTNELNILDGVTSDANDLNLVDGITAGTASASKAVILDSNKDITGIRHLTLTGDLTVEGDTVTLNTETLTVEDKVVEIGKNATNSSTSDGAGIIVGGWSGCPSILYDDTGTQWELNKNTDVTGTFKCSGAATLTGGISDTTLDFGAYQ
tara:strand:- start:746 stop:1531 length:786 start_codon:yes stop_codon:yes gene_type:complete